MKLSSSFNCNGHVRGSGENRISLVLATGTVQTTKAVVVVELTVKAAVRDVLQPKVRNGWLLARVKAVAINPTDWKHVAWAAADVRCRVGCDYAGVVEEVGANVTNFQPGDRITGWIHGSNRANHEYGAFAELAIAKACVQMKVPDNMSFEEAPSLGVAHMTVLAKLSGLTVITTSSTRNFDLVKSLGADAAFDYNSPTCGKDIKRFTNNKLLYSWDCTGDGAGICAAAMSDAEPGTYGTIMPADYELLARTNPKVTGQEFMCGYDTQGEFYYWLGDVPVQPDPTEMEFYRMFLELTQRLLESGAIKPPRMSLNKMGGGLEGVAKGLAEMQAGLVLSAEKLVYTI
ncbi:putative alcohol dehydrogenase [Emericellopsis atlantica]|uniref:Alcohol dehydrogenase n=1 Tax=Emericellopsis atlantica TaxID=2614577 RepID=A0A9P8CLA6_9HYPO|nr:putative alcohol dehydrogenase [Emericellopsis atlantica]KAG9250800.1 putative alcohol dehydrogenase [Emericellopsis atlantica]